MSVEKILKNITKLFYVKQFLYKSSVVGGLICFIASSMAYAANTKDPRVVLYTSEGTIKIELDETNTPITTKNFLYYVKSHTYDNTIFHRVIDGFMIQGGGLTADMKIKPTIAPIKNEGKLCGSNVRGSIAMARTSDPNSATDQFFINVVDNVFLDYQSETLQGWGYCAFGHVVEGMDVVDKIKSVPTTTRDGFENVPVKPVLIQHVDML